MLDTCPSAGHITVIALLQSYGIGGIGGITYYILHAPSELLIIDLLSLLNMSNKRRNEGPHMSRVSIRFLLYCIVLCKLGRGRGS